MQNRIIFLIAFTLATTLHLSSAVIYNSESSFLANIKPAYYNNDFELEDSLNTVSTSQSYPRSTSPLDPTPDPNNGYSYTAIDTTNAIYVTQSNIATDNLTADLVITFNPSKLPTAFGGYFAPTNAGGAPQAQVLQSIRVTLNNNSTELFSYTNTFVDDLPNQPQDFIGFGGFASPITKIEVLSPPQPQNGQHYATIERLVIGEFQPVPEPTTLSSLGLFGLVALRRRRC